MRRVFYCDLCRKYRDKVEAVEIHKGNKKTFGKACQKCLGEAHNKKPESLNLPSVLKQLLNSGQARIKL